MQRQKGSLKVLTEFHDGIEAEVLSCENSGCR